MGEAIIVSGAIMIFKCVCWGIDYYSRTIEQGRIRKRIDQILDESDKLNR